MSESQAIQDIRCIDVRAAINEALQTHAPMKTIQCVTPYVEKSWKKTWAAGKHEATKQAKAAYPRSRVRLTGRTFHSATDWAFEFEVVEPGGDR